MYSGCVPAVQVDEHGKLVARSSQGQGFKVPKYDPLASLPPAARTMALMTQEER